MGIEATTDAGDPVYFVSTEEVDAATVRAFDAELEAAVAFLQSMRRSAGPSPSTLVLDLRQVRFLDSRGLQSLLNVHRDLAAEQLGLQLQNAQGVVLRLLEVTGALEHVNGSAEEAS